MADSQVGEKDDVAEVAHQSADQAKEIFVVNVVSYSQSKTMGLSNKINLGPSVGS